MIFSLDIVFGNTCYYLHNQTNQYKHSFYYFLLLKWDIRFNVYNIWIVNIVKAHEWNFRIITFYLWFLSLNVYTSFSIKKLICGIWKLYCLVFKVYLCLRGFIITITIPVFSNDFIGKCKRVVWWFPFKDWPSCWNLVIGM